MKKKDFKSLSVSEQKGKINEFITSWYEQDSNNRCALVILGDRKDEEDLGTSSCALLGPGRLVEASLETILNKDKDFRDITMRCLMRPLARLLASLDKLEEGEE